MRGPLNFIPRRIDNKKHVMYIVYTYVLYTYKIYLYMRIILILNINRRVQVYAYYVGLLHEAYCCFSKEIERPM